MTLPYAQDRLLERAQDGDLECLVQLLETVGPCVRAIIEPKIGRKHRSVLSIDDVMQVTYMECISRIHTFTGGGTRGFQAWLVRIAENNLIDAVRGLEAAKRPNPSRRIDHHDRDDSMIAMVEAIGVTVSTPSLAAARGEVVRTIHDALERLPADYARVIMMYDLQGRTIDEVVHEMGRTKGAVYMLRARAHEHLREVLGSESKYFTKVD
jgi:RNA polymerase sigma-70 factor (ECF subfamily)